VLSQPQKIFVFVVQALEAETLQGQIATKVISSAKGLLQVTGQDPSALLAQMSLETQQVVQAFFS
jgi:importin-5